MSRDFHLLIDAAVSARTIRDDFVNGPAFSVVVTPSTKDDVFLAEPGIANPTLTVTLMPNTNAKSRVAATRVAATRAIYASVAGFTKLRGRRSPDGARREHLRAAY
jgi:hypothetical protein